MTITKQLYIIIKRLQGWIKIYSDAVRVRERTSGFNKLWLNSSRMLEIDNLN